MLPPSRFRAEPHCHDLPARSRLWRVHHRKAEPTAFTSRPAEGPIGGRFDGTPDDPYAFYYAAPIARTALAERFLRDVEYDPAGTRHIPRAAVANQRISVVETVAALRLVSLLDAEALAAVAADGRLIHSDEAAYPGTRRWASWIRAEAPWAQGLVWPSKRQVGDRAVVLFGDRCPEGPLAVNATSRVDLDDDIGAAWINAMLAPCRAMIRAPR